ncbi:MAG: glycosyltransferase family 4 protein [Firmicutes bacterium]|nr:glycosyltransferase family 4 protein [Bacillota bacterium]
MARICIDARPAITARGTGIGNYTYQLIWYLSRLDEGHDYYLLWPDEGTLPWPLGSNFRYKPMSRKRHEEAAELPYWLEKERIDLYHAPDNGLHAFLTPTCNLVVTIHDLIPFVMPETVRRGYRQNFLEKVPEIAQQAQCIITVSEVARRDICTILGVSLAKTRVIYPAPEAIFVPSNPLRAQSHLCCHYGIDRPYLLYAGGLNPRKNVGELIYAFAKARKYFQRDLLLVIPGKPSDDMPDLSALCTGLGIFDKVRFPGFMPMEDLVTTYQGAEIFVYPSLYEGFGLPPLEAMAVGVPVISSPVPSVTEVAMNAALIFNPEDTTALAAHLHRGLGDTDLRQLMKERGKEVVAALSWPKVARATLATYNEILNNSTNNLG